VKNKADRSRVTPDGWHTVTPRIFTHDPKGLVQFLTKVFAATGDYQRDRPSEIWIGDSVIMISDTAVRPPVPGFLYVYVKDADAIYKRAIRAGARSLEEPSDLPYGDRRCMIEDQWGNTWQIATRL